MGASLSVGTAVCRIWEPPNTGSISAGAVPSELVDGVCDSGICRRACDSFARKPPTVLESCWAAVAGASINVMELSVRGMQVPLPWREVVG